MTSDQVMRVKRRALTACMTCPLCNKLMRGATTISECLHTFCRKCIYEKLTDEEIECCPICNIDLGCVPVEKLRPDHTLQDIRAKIFPLKEDKDEALDPMLPISLPVRRKERSLSSLVVSTPRVSPHIGLTGKRTRAVARKVTSFRASTNESFRSGAVTNKYNPHTSSSLNILDKVAQRKKQNPFKEGPSRHMVNIKTENEAEQHAEGDGIWKPLDCLFEAAIRPKSFKSSLESSTTKTELNEPIGGLNIHKSKMKGYLCKVKLQNNKKRIMSASSGLYKARKLHSMARALAISRDKCNSTSVLLGARRKRQKRRDPSIWFSFVASNNQDADAALPQISSSYLRVRDGGLPVSFLKKYLVKKLDLKSESEVELMCCGQPVVSNLAMDNLVDLWMRGVPNPKRVSASPGTSAKDMVLVIAYSRKSMES